MKRFVSLLILGIFLLSFPRISFSQQNQLDNYEQEQAMHIAHEVALQKSFAGSPVEDVNLSAADLVAKGHEAWANFEFVKAKMYFERAAALEPYNKNIGTLVCEVEKARINDERRKVQFKQKIVEEKRMLDVDKAWMIDEPQAKARESGREGKRIKSKLKAFAEQKKVSVDFSDAQLSKVFEYLSEAGGINIIMDEAAVARAGSVSIRLKDVSLVLALESILRTKGLGYRFEDDFIWISTKEAISSEDMVTRIYYLSQGLATFTQFTTFDTVTIKSLRGDGTVVVGKDEKNPEDAGTGAKAVDTYEGVKIGGPGGVAGKLTMTIKDVLKEIIQWPEGSSIFLDNRTSTLIARNTPSNLAIIEQTLEALDVNPPQVMIEARFVEIGSDDLFSLGVKLNGEISATGVKTSHTFPYKKDQETDYTTPFQSNTLSVTDTSSGAVIVDTKQLFDFTLGTLDFSQFKAVLSAIESNANSNTLSSPKVTTISGQEAVIKIVKEYRYPTKYDIQTFDVVVSGQTRTIYVSVPAEFKTRDIGIILKVTPNVGNDGRTINLTLVPEVSEFDINKDMFNYGTADNPYLQPFFSVRNATASIVVNNNDTVVMGGLMREVVDKGVHRVPILGSIPLLGPLFFTHKHDNKQKRNLLIFVTARIIAPTGETVQK
ncbi:MAG: hypothetical protein KJ893_10185 [Candidatus Omnitrophica bacterium]|nr:hypothetical protein [Candidatus Omnitrophota bacterium]MBU4479356.1 hypothetical protein [Candidatus Omnitrophota bacterium]MCG2703832.1 hypothetical protein [Candidatus Omnitrophota bacterium]